MKQFYNKIRILTVMLMTASVLQGQDKNEYSWQLGAGVGYTNYYGDMSNYRIHNIKDAYKVFRFTEFNKQYHSRPSFSLLAQRKLNSTVGIMIQANSLEFAMSDRYRKQNGEVDPEALNYNRALNFRTNLQDIGFALTFNSNNGRLFSEEAVFYPSFYVGIGLSHFTVKGDLYDANGAQYNYNTPGYINDGSYETNLRDLNTEEGDRYSNVAPYMNLGLALNFRINSFLSLALQSDIKYSGSDYLDDLSKTYKTNYNSPEAAYAARPGFNDVDPITLSRGDNNGVNDIYINNRLAVFYTLHPKKKKTVFKAPVIYSIRRADTSLIPMRMRSSDTTKPVFSSRLSNASAREKRLRDSVNRLDSIIRENRKRDSLTKASQVRDTAFQSSIDNRLGSVQQELQNIKTVLRNQSLMPRYRYLQFQHDSIARLSSGINAKRSITPTDRLKLRVHGLQQDSLRNEMQKLIWMTQYPAKDYDSTLLNFDPLSELRTGQWPETNHHADTVSEVPVANPDPAPYDSLVVLNSYQSKLDQLKAETFYQTDPGYKSRVDSLEDRLMGSGLQTPVNTRVKGYTDSVDRANQQKFEQMQKRLDSLESVERRIYQEFITDSARDRQLSARRNVDTVRARRNVDTVRARSSRSQRAVDTSIADVRGTTEERTVQQEINNAQLNSEQNKADSLEKALEASTASLRSMEAQAKASRDSAAYYRRTLYARDLEPEDTIVSKRKWYQRILPASKRQKEQEKENADAIELSRQASYYEAQTRSMNRDIEQLQRANRNLEDNYNQLRRRRNNNLLSNTPVVIPTNVGSNRREIDELRNEISMLRAQLMTPPVTNQRDTVVTQLVPAPTAPVVVHRDTAQLIALQSDLLALQKEMDSLRRRPAPEKVKAPVYDVSSFPVVSVYFAMNASTLPPTQTDKIAPIVAAANKNKAAKIVLKGFTDPVGNATVNKALAIKRTNYVKSLLLDRYKLPANQIITAEPEISDVKGVKRANPLDRRVDLQFQ